MFGLAYSVLEKMSAHVHKVVIISKGYHQSSPDFHISRTVSTKSGIGNKSQKFAYNY